MELINLMRLDKQRSVNIKLSHGSLGKGAVCTSRNGNCARPPPPLSHVYISGTVAGLYDWLQHL